MQEINEPLSLIDGIVYSENSPSTNEFSKNKEWDDSEKINILIKHLTFLSNKYGLVILMFLADLYKVSYIYLQYHQEEL